MILLGVLAARPAFAWFICQSNGAGIFVGMWWAAIFGVARLFLRANRWAGGLMVPHAAYATYVSLAVWWTWLR